MSTLDCWLRLSASCVPKCMLDCWPHPLEGSCLSCQESSHAWTHHAVPVPHQTDKRSTFIGGSACRYQRPAVCNSQLLTWRYQTTKALVMQGEENGIFSRTTQHVLPLRRAEHVRSTYLTHSKDSHGKTALEESGFGLGQHLHSPTGAHPVLLWQTTLHILCLL